MRIIRYLEIIDKPGVVLASFFSFEIFLLWEIYDRSFHKTITLLWNIKGNAILSKQ